MKKLLSYTLLALICMLLLSGCGEDEKYEKALTDLATGNYAAASDAFSSLGDYGDSIRYSTYAKALQNVEDGDIAAASERFSMLGGFLDSKSYAAYYDAVGKENDGSYEEAYALYEQVSGFLDADDRKDGLADKALDRDIEEAIGKMHENGASWVLEDDTMRGLLEREYTSPEKSVSQRLIELAGEEDEAGNKEYASTLYQLLSETENEEGTNRYLKLRAEEYYAAGDYASAWDILSGLSDEYNEHTADYEDMYKAAEQLLTDGKYGEAADAFEALGSYTDAADRVLQVKYAYACDLLEEGSVKDAVEIFTELGDYSDAAVKISQTEADSLFEQGDYAGAWSVYSVLDEDYRKHDTDYADMYAGAQALLDEGRYDEAAEAFTLLGGYSDSALKAQESRYQSAVSLHAAGLYDQAQAVYEGLEDYSDVSDRLLKLSADRLYDDGDIAGAWDIYSGLDEAYDTHAEDYLALYTAAQKLLDDGDYEGAQSAFMALGGYSDAAEKALAAYEAGIEENKGDEPTADDPDTESGKALLDTYMEAAQLAVSGDHIAAAEKWLSIRDYSDSREQCYRLALSLTDTKPLDAITILSMDIEYSDAREQIYRIGKEALEGLDYETAEAAFTAVGGYSDAEDLLDDALRAEGKIDETPDVTDQTLENDTDDRIAGKAGSGEVIATSDGTVGTDGDNTDNAKEPEGEGSDGVTDAAENGEIGSETSDQTENIDQPAEEETDYTYLASAVEGDTVYFGSYEQDDDAENGPEDIEWVVLENDGDTVLLISALALDSAPYHDRGADVTWERCSLRIWLNDAFLQNAFTPEEQALIQLTLVEPDANPDYANDPGNATEDRVFLLSISEAQEYFADDAARVCYPSAYTVGKGAYVYSVTGSSRWLLRTPGMYSESVSNVSAQGEITTSGRSVNDRNQGIRPAIRISLEALNENGKDIEE
ncbi:MAG: hypothetical protein J5859_05030 [Clostridia bacterium]|nr:hypothetical protein [Clostridia bacterium]